MPQNRLKILAAAALLALTAFSCASRPPAASRYPLLDASIRTTDGAVTGRIPMGWNSAPGDTIPPGVDAWLVSDDGTAFMALREINLDRPTGQRVRQEGLELLARLSIAFRSDSAHAAASVPVRGSVLNDLKVCSYELATAGQWKSVIVMTLKGRFYECEANVAGGATEITRRVADAQKAFCASLATSTRE